MHVPKTGGTTLSRIVDSYFQKEQICPAYYMPELFKIPINELHKYRLFRGHLSYSICQLLKNPVCITVLRDPVQRIFSYYRFICSREHHPKHHILSQMSLMEVLNDRAESVPISNHQTRFLGRDLDLSVLKARFNGDTKTKPQKKSEIDLELAKKRLKNFGCIGLTERFDDSLFLMAYTFNWPVSLDYQWLNKTQEGAETHVDITDEVIEKIVDMNELDLQLYEYAKGIFEKRFQEMKQEIALSYGIPSKELTREKIREYLRQKDQI
jgi:hypothetical protein